MYSNLLIPSSQSSNNIKYLVLGSEGQIGKSLVRYLLEHNEEVLEFDIKRNKNEDLRIKDNQLFIDNLLKCDFVFFLAWDVGGSKYLEKCEKTFDFIHNNVSIMNNTFKYLQEFKKPFIFTSSQMIDMIGSVYGNTKLIGEKYTEIIGGLNVRMWNVYGEEKEEEKSHVITDFILKAKNNGYIDMLTTGEESRQFLYAEDCCEAFHILSKEYYNLPRDKNFHITSFEWKYIWEIAEEVSKQMKCEWNRGEKIDRVQNDLKIDPDKYILNYWEPKTSLEKGIKCLMKNI